MKKPLALFALALLAGAGAAPAIADGPGAPGGSGGPGGEHRQPSPEMQAFCSQHRDECQQLRSLHQTARQTCENKDAKVGDCQAARSAARAQMEKMEGEGMPAPQRRGMGGYPFEHAS